MSLKTHNDALDALVASLAATLPWRFVQRSLIDPANEKTERLISGVLCVVSGNGGKFANYRGREGDLGTMGVQVVGFVKVGEKTAASAIEVAELDLLGDLLNWVSSAAVPGLDAIYAGDWQQSKQLEHPYGWLVLALDVKT